MDYKFIDYKIQIVDSGNFPGKFVAYIEELYDVACIIENKTEASDRLRPLFDKEINRLIVKKQIIPKPGSGKAKITFASKDKIEGLRPFIDDFWDKTLGTSYSTSFVSDESFFHDWEHYLDSGKDELISKVKHTYSIDISPIYDKPIHEILSIIKNNNIF